MESWLMEASNLGTGSVYDWLRNLLYGNDLTGQSLEIMNQELENTEIGADGIIAYPYLAGKGMPEWSNQKTGCILNLKISSKKPDIARAFLEGLAFEVSECYTRMENIAGKPETVQVSGGLSNFPLFNQMLADMLNRTITAVACSETTARGAYIVLMLSCGAITEKDMDSILDKGEPVVYVPNLKNIELYSKLRRKRKNIEKQMPFEEISSQV
jgi:sugar (pentulose or hexulose) kinase